MVLTVYLSDELRSEARRCIPNVSAFVAAAIRAEVARCNGVKELSVESLDDLKVLASQHLIEQKAIADKYSELSLKIQTTEEQIAREEKLKEEQKVKAAELKQKFASEVDAKANAIKELFVSEFSAHLVLNLSGNEEYNRWMGIRYKFMNIHRVSALKIEEWKKEVLKDRGN